MHKIRVKLGDRSYYIYIGKKILLQLGEMLKGERGAIITDKNVYKYWGKEIKKLKLPVYVIQPGETQKSLYMAERIYKALLKFGLDRQSMLVAFGGGVVGDLAGYVAATYMRGISYAQIPTTLMAQVDSSIGGKTGVNLPEGKNLIGCFCQPKFVFIDTNLLRTLPKRELKSGLAEVIKYGVIKDKQLFEYLEKNKQEKYNWQYIIKRCARIKADIVSRDERETKGLRMILNYGHTIGHALESSSKYKGITHGEAVAQGMIAAAKISNKLGYLSLKDTVRQINLIKTLVAQSRTVLFRDIRHDKKAVCGKLRFVLADRIGHVFVTDKVRDRLWQM